MISSTVKLTLHMKNLKKMTLFVTFAVVSSIWFFNLLVINLSATKPSQENLREVKDGVGKMIMLNQLNLSWPDQFHPTINSSQKIKMLELLRLFKRQMDKFNITFSLYSGSLLGAYRHHGMIPWDDDIDLLIDANHKRKMIEALKEVSDTHNMKNYTENGIEKWKFYKLGGHVFQHKPFGYPYLDIFFFVKFNKTTFFVNILNFYFPRKILFPLIYRNFEGMSLPTPCNTKTLLTMFYQNFDKCVSGSWNHSTEFETPQESRISTSCNQLKPFLPFTERTTIQHRDHFKVKEKLKKGMRILEIVTYTLPLTCSGIHFSFSSDLAVQVF